ncbi:MAG: zinc ribbon domain-containing protein [Candidatus Hodarchaeales archaeon]|jgi:transposase
MRVIRTERIWLKPTTQLRHLCHISKNLFNEVNYLVRQAFFTEKKWIQSSQLKRELLVSPNFQQLPVPTAQKVLQLVDKAWKSFFAAKADWKAHPVIKQVESYSSKCSFLDNEPIEHHNNYLGRRITRGLFKSQQGTIINADVNGVYNILKKAFLNAVDADRIEAVGLHPTRWRLAAVTS